tara:strand:+ start:283 stop:570 length:288 start_codon:yes stop_codon:yes gene_type:complete
MGRTLTGNVRIIATVHTGLTPRREQVGLMPKRTTSYTFNDIKGGDYFKRKAATELLNLKIKIIQLEAKIQTCKSELHTANIDIIEAEERFKENWI